MSEETYVPPRWIGDIMKERETTKSALILVETNDPKRVDEFMEYWAIVVEKKYTKKVIDSTGLERKVNVEVPPLIIYDAFGGLYEMRETPTYGWAEVPIGEQSLLGDTTLKTLDARLMTTDVSKGPQTVVIRNILKAEDFNGKWPNALNGWACHDTLLGQGHTIIIFAPSRTVIPIEVLDKAIYYVPPMSEESERRELLLRAARYKGITLSEEQVVEMVQLMAGLDINKTQAVAAEAVITAKGTEGVNPEVISKAKADIINKSGTVSVRMDPGQGFERIGGYDVLKGWVRETIIEPLKNPERARKLGMEPPRGAILFGPPGTGKTVFARALAKELNMPFVELSPEQYMTSYVGESEKNLERTFRVIDAMSPVLVFIDEIDRLGARGQGLENDGGTSRRLLNAYLSWLSDPRRKALVIGATNLPEQLDPALVREGRIDVMIPMLSPNEDARYEILKIHLNVVRKVAHNISDELLRRVARDTRNWKGNMLEELVKRATRIAFERGSEMVEGVDLMEALQDYRPKTKQLESEEERYYKLAEELTNSEKFLRMMRNEPVTRPKGRMGQLEGSEDDDDRTEDLETGGKDIGTDDRTIRRRAGRPRDKALSPGR